MTKRIFRYSFDVDTSWSVEMPIGAKVLPLPPGTRNEGSVIEFWALVDDAAPMAPREFWVVGTGASLPDSCGRFVGTVLSHGGEYV